MNDTIERVSLGHTQTTVDSSAVDAHLIRLHEIERRRTFKATVIGTGIGALLVGLGVLAATYNLVPHAPSPPAPVINVPAPVVNIAPPPPANVTVNVPTADAPPAAPQNMPRRAPELPRRPGEEPKIVEDFSKFIKDTTMPGIVVVTGYNYATQYDNAPNHQHCYISPVGGPQLEFEMQIDGRVIPYDAKVVGAAGITEAQWREAFRYCHWYGR